MHVIDATGIQRTADRQLALLLGGYRVTQMLYVAAELRLADVLASGPRDAESLAAAVGAHPISLRRLLRALAAHGVFSQDDYGRFGMSPVAEGLRADADASLRPMALTYGAPWWWAAFGELLHSVRTGEPAFRKAHGQGLFEYLEQDGHAAAVFHSNMTAMTGAAADAIACACSLQSTGLVADIGGGQGALVAALLHRYPALRAILFDRPEVLAGAAAAFKLPEFEGRCTMLEGDFFEEVSAKADVYVLKDVLHDWDDANVVRLLRNVRRVMPDDARVLVVERLLQPGNVPDDAKELDITMLAMTGGAERSEDEYADLLATAGLKLTDVRPTSTPSSVLEARIALA